MKPRQRGQRPPIDGQTAHPVPLKIVEIAGSQVAVIGGDESLDMAEVRADYERAHPRPPKVYPTPRPFHLIPTDFAERMARARDADEGRTIIHEHELAVWEAQVYAGWHTKDHPEEDWLVGPMPWGCRGFSVLGKARFRKLAAASPLCGVLVAVGQQMRLHWDKLLAAEQLGMVQRIDTITTELRQFGLALAALHQQHDVGMFFKSGDLCEMFGEDARIALKACANSNLLQKDLRFGIDRVSFSDANRTAVCELLAKTGRKYLLFNREQLPAFP